MNLNIETTLELEKLPESHLLVVEEATGIDGCPIVSCILERCVKKGHSILFILFHNTIGHYYGMATKLGYNLMAYKARNKLFVVDGMEQIFDVTSNVENEDWSILKRIFLATKTLVEKAQAIGEQVTLILEHPSNLLIAGVSIEKVIVFTQYIRSLCKDKTSLVCLVKNEPVQQLVNSLHHKADLSVKLEGLDTGSAAGITGRMSLRRKNQVLDDNNQSLFHYEVLDKRIRVFAPGFVMIK